MPDKRRGAEANFAPACCNRQQTSTSSPPAESGIKVTTRSHSATRFVKCHVAARDVLRFTVRQHYVRQVRQTITITAAATRDNPPAATNSVLFSPPRSQRTSVPTKNNKARSSFASQSESVNATISPPLTAAILHVARHRQTKILFHGGYKRMADRPRHSVRVAPATIFCVSSVEPSSTRITS